MNCKHKWVLAKLQTIGGAKDEFTFFCEKCLEMKEVHFWWRIETFKYSYYLLPIKMKLKCKKCSNEWDYKGSNPYYATCSKCLNKVKVQKQDKEKGSQKSDW